MIGSDISLPSDLTVSDFFTAEFVRIERGDTESLVVTSHTKEPTVW